MAVDFKTEHKRGSEYLFYPEDIIVRPEDNGRVDPGKVPEIKRSFELLGQLQPVGVRNEGGRPVLTFGFSRWQAAVEFNAGKPRELQMRLRCVFQRVDGLQAIVANIHENHVRAACTEMDDAHNIARLMDGYGKTVEEIAEHYGQDIKWVKRRLKLLKLTPEVQQAVTNGEIKVTAAEKIAALVPEAQKAALDNGGKPAEPAGDPKPAKPSAKQIRLAIDQIAASPAYPKAVREFCDRLVKFMNGELEESNL